MVPISRPTSQAVDGTNLPLGKHEQYGAVFDKSRLLEVTSVAIKPTKNNTDGELNDDTTAGDLLQDYKARLAARAL